MSFGQCHLCKTDLSLEEYNACRHRPSGDTPALCFPCLYRTVDKLPKTADGLPIYPGSQVFVRKVDPESHRDVITGPQIIHRIGRDVIFLLETKENCEWANVTVQSDCYSTREAAEEAKP